MNFVLKSFVFTYCLLLLSIHLMVAQNCANNRFTNVPTFSDAEITTQLNISYGSAVDLNGITQNLVLDVYYPNLSIDTLKLRPFIFLVHGGGFWTGQKEDFTRICKEFAKRGFIAATINYRLGFDCTTDSISKEKANYRAQQDANAAMRFAIQNSNYLRLDTSWIFVGGASAGSSIALNMVYTTQSEWNSLYPTLPIVLGNLNNSGNALNHKFRIKGLFNNWGCIVKNNIQTAEMLPMVSFHGDADSAVALDSSNGGGCYKSYNLYGSRALHNLLLSKNICSDLSVKPGGGHGVYEDSIGTAFRIGRACCFFKSLFCNTCTSFYSTQQLVADCSIPTNIITQELDLKQVFPNPVTESFKVKGLNEKAMLLLIDINGNVLLKKEVFGEEIIPINNLPQGVYFVQMITKSNTFQNKLIKQ